MPKLVIIKFISLLIELIYNKIYQEAQSFVPKILHLAYTKINSHIAVRQTLQTNVNLFILLIIQYIALFHTH